ncbi:MAG TPA: PIG-L family deacetylase, partial [Vicinamibacteria bacterium]
MKLSRPEAEVFVPDGTPLETGLGRTTHLGVVAHPDDLEILAWPAIRDCFEHGDLWFSGVVVTDGAGSSRTGPYAAFTDEKMRTVRRLEQRKAAMVGEYAAVILLDHASDGVKSPPRREVLDDLSAVLRACRPSVVYTHNLADRHDTHVATALATVEACRALSPDDRPSRLLGGEVWRDL